MVRLLCLGDSITDCGRNFACPPLGNGYVSLLSEKLNKYSHSCEVVNCGVDGFTVSRLMENAKSCYIPYNADIISILIGINDISLMINTSRSRQQQNCMMEDFLLNYEHLIQLLTTISMPEIILMEPFVLPRPAELSNWFPYIETMSRGISSLAAKYHCPYIKLHHRLNDDAQKYGIDFITADGIHLTANGHEILAEELFHVLSD